MGVADEDILGMVVEKRRRETRPRRTRPGIYILYEERKGENGKEGCMVATGRGRFNAVLRVIRFDRERIGERASLPFSEWSVRPQALK